MRDLHELPKFRDSLSYLYVEHARVEQDDLAIAFFTDKGKYPVPCANLSVLMLGPGTSITHAAISTLADIGCFVMWVGEQGVRFYAQGMGDTRHAKWLGIQAALVSNPTTRLAVVQKMYALRFAEPIDPSWTIAQLRGREGARVKHRYSEIAQQFGLTWTGRNYNRADWDQADPFNKALSVANTCLYGLAHCAIVSLGLSPGLGFIHTGHQRSFAYDLADLYKLDLTVPMAFHIVTLGVVEIERRTRIACRSLFHATHLLALLVEDLKFLLDAQMTQVPPDRINLPIRDLFENWRADQLAKLTQAHTINESPASPPSFPPVPSSSLPISPSSPPISPSSPPIFTSSPSSPPISPPSPPDPLASSPLPTVPHPILPPSHRSSGALPSEPDDAPDKTLVSPKLPIDANDGILDDLDQPIMIPSMLWDPTLGAIPGGYNHSSRLHVHQRNIDEDLV